MNSHPNIKIIGIGGCSRSGKTLLTNELINQYKNIDNINSYLFSNVYSSIHLDRYFNIDKINKNIVRTKFGNSYGNWEFPGALDWVQFYMDINNEIKELSEKIKKSSSPNKKGILFIEGFLLFSPCMINKKDESDYLDLFDYYIYICLDKSTAKLRRMRTTTVPDDYYEYILWPEHIKYCSKYINFFRQKNEENKNILIIDGNKEYSPKGVAICILNWIGAFNKLDVNYIDIYKNLFNSFNIQFNLLKKNFS